MKKLFLAFLMVMFVGITSASASHCPAGYKRTLNSNGSAGSQCYQDIDTDTDTDTLGQPQDEFGVGVDAVMWQNDTEKLKMIEEVTTEYRYDIDNENHSVYGVVRVNLWDKIKGLFGRNKTKTVAVVEEPVVAEVASTEVIQ